MDFKFNELKMDWKVATTVVVSTLLIVIDHYNALFAENWQDHFFLYMLIPLVLIKVIYRQPLAQFGWRWGDWKAGLILTLGGWALLSVIMIYVAPTPEFQAYYSHNQDDPLRVIFTAAFDLIGWEFIFRGWLLFTLFPICGPAALILQAVPFTIAHFGKPQLETISCIFGGPLYGYVAWRTRSFVYPFAIHWYLNVITILLSRVPV